MSLKITRKGYYRLTVNGSMFSQHVGTEEAYENASEILAADPSLTLEVLPPAYEVASSEGSVAVPDASQPTSDGGMDLGDFLDFASGGLGTDTGIIEAHDFAHALGQFAVGTREKSRLVFTRFFYPDQDGKQRFTAVGWKGWIASWYFRKRGAITIGSDES